MGSDRKDDDPKVLPETAGDQPEVYGIVKEADGFKLTRRNLWSVLGAGTAAAAATACATSKKTRRIRQMGPKTWTQPCGTPIPPNAVCVCNCIATNANFRSDTEQVCICDTIEVPVGQAITGGTTTCLCDQVCTCNTVGGSSGGGGSYGGGGHYWHPN